MSKTLEQVNANIRAELARKGLTQADLAAHLDLPAGSVSVRLKGQVAWRLDELAKVADLLGIAPELLLAA